MASNYLKKVKGKDYCGHYLSVLLRMILIVCTLSFSVDNHRFKPLKCESTESCYILHIVAGQSYVVDENKSKSSNIMSLMEI